MSTLVALHGFLGCIEDWDLWDPKQLGAHRLISYAIQPAENFNTWAKNFNAWVIAHTNAPRILMGYSMGGRLALHALLENPSLWKKGLLISTHPGLKTNEEKEKRLVSDQVWAAKFRKMHWEALMHDWENQPVFKLSLSRPLRKEEDYNRESLALQLENFSLGKQEDFLPLLSHLNIPLEWVTGAKDSKAESLAKEAVKCHVHSSHFSVPGASHRVHFEFPNSLVFDKILD